MEHPLAIEFSGLGISYEGREVLSAVDLAVKQGEKVILDGPSGSGKTTLLKCVMGLVVPTQGTVRIFGRQLDRHTIWELRAQVGYVPQEPDLGSGSVQEVLERPFRLKANAGKRERLDLVPQLMEAFNLPRVLLDKRISTLSGGEKQRVALLVTQLLDRSVVILDEATSALDQAQKHVVAQTFMVASELTVLSISHDAEWLSFPARRISVAKGHVREVQV